MRKHFLSNRRTGNSKWFLFIFIAALIIGCSSSDSSDPDPVSIHAETIDISGTWQQSTSGDVGKPPIDRFVFIQDGKSFTQYFECGSPLPTPSPCTFKLDGYNVSAKCGTALISNGTINKEQNQITGSVTDNQGSGTFILNKLSDATDFVSNGSIIINGDFCGNAVNINSPIVCAYKDMENGSLNGLEMYTSYNGEAFGIDIESTGSLMSDTTYDIMADDFIIELQGAAVSRCYNSDYEKPAASGTVSIDVYDGRLLQGSFDLTFQSGYTLTGSFDVTL